MLNGKDVKQATDINFLKNLSSLNKKEAYLKIENLIIENCEKGLYQITFSYKDKNIDSDIFSLLEDNNYFKHMVANGFGYYYDPDIGEYTIRWIGESAGDVMRI